ncbi:MAG TPA: BlaI/MecI/CopY family transcriptional regulator [Flavilitoribacter sp.]|nr:BlaI/MecI/CopY family transcriptional regulator [Flavilitoribacter sp.]HMQ87892.1 BlaI/MecI/CopY family transcriptional regulator [Flavilitoribacter sp.]
MQKLAKREEQIMQILWRLNKAFVKEIMDEFPEPKPHYNTVSTIIRILEEKGYVDHEQFGNTYRYYPILKKEIYQQQELGDILEAYFDNSYPKMVAYFARQEKISPEELEDILKMIRNEGNRNS